MYFGSKSAAFGAAHGLLLDIPSGMPEAEPFNVGRVARLWKHALSLAGRDNPLRSLGASWENIVPSRRKSMKIFCEETRFFRG